MARSLIVVDLQNDFIDGGALPTMDADQAAARVARYVTANEGGYDYVVTTQDWHYEPGDHFSETPDFVNTWPPHCVPGTPGAELSPRLDSILYRIDQRFFKGQVAASYSGFDGHDRQSGLGRTLAEYLHEHDVTEVDIVGTALEYCVKATAIDAAKLGFTTRVLPLYCGYIAHGPYREAVAEMREAGVTVPDPAVA